MSWQEQEELGFYIDEAPLREWIIKAYHEVRETEGDSEFLLGAMRQFLSGPSGAPSEPEAYYFERDADAHLRQFLDGLKSANSELAESVFRPLLRSLDKKGPGQEENLAPNLSLYVASLSGPIALKMNIDETIASGLVSSALIGLSRIGVEQVRRTLDEG